MSVENANNTPAVHVATSAAKDSATGNLKPLSPYSDDRQSVWNGTAVALAAFFFILIFSRAWIGGTPLTWSYGTFKAADLAQHYVAGLMWNQHRSFDLYRNFEFSQELVEWFQTLPVTEEAQLKLGSFNYVYPPIIGLAASALTRWNFASWVWIWLAIMIATIALAWFLLTKIVTGVRPKCPKDWILLFSFPGVWYALIPHQNSTITLFLVSAASLLSSRNSQVAAGMITACAFYKPQFVLCIGLMMLVAKQYRFILGLATGSAVWLAIQLQICGFGLNMAWIQSVFISIEGRQFQWAGLNQSWRGLFLSLAGSSSGIAGGISIFLSIALLIGAGFWIHKLEMLKSWQPGFQVIIASAFWTVASPYTAFYDFLMILGLWLICCRTLPNTFAGTGICFLGWIASLACIAGGFGFPWLAAPLLTLWIFLAIKLISNSTRQNRLSVAL